MNRLQIILIRLALLAAVLAAWEYLPRNNIVNPLLLPPLSNVLAMLGELLTRPQVQEAIWITALEVLLAFVDRGAGRRHHRHRHRGERVSRRDLPADHLLHFATPNSIFLPMFILVFGIGFQQKVAYAAFSASFIVLMSAMAAVHSVKSDHVLVARSYGATRACRYCPASTCRACCRSCSRRCASP
jgi:NitT/TauT family transport system permease protein